MSAFPHFSNISEYVQTELKKRKGNNSYLSKRNVWIRVASAVNLGCQILSNPNFQLFGNAPSIYGFSNLSGTIGKEWNSKKSIVVTDVMGFRPKPNITSLEIDEGAGNLSRKASFTIICYTKNQLDEVCKYFLEPGFTIFLEWGWNTALGVSQFTEVLVADEVAKFQDFAKVNEKREAAGGHYDNYLGFITGGSISTSGDTWQVNVKLTGFTELPAYLMTTDKLKTDENTPKEAARLFQPTEISSQQDLGKKRFMMMFNKLPANRLSEDIRGLIDTPKIAHPANFLNFDEGVKTKINDETDGFNLLGLQIISPKVKTEGSKVETPEGTKIISDNSYIRFGTLMTIFNKIFDGGLKLAGSEKLIKLTVSSERCICSAFEKIYSTDASKLFIPNLDTPKFSLKQAAETTVEQSTYNGSIDCSIICTNGDLSLKFQFPMQEDLKGGKVKKNDDTINIQPKIASFNSIDKKAKTYGFLDDLYVNMDFVRGIIETKNFSVKDALYQILNGMSSAAGGIWDFNIIESTNGRELEIVELNVSGKVSSDDIIKLELMGVDSIFIDASLDIDISGAKMNQIIGSRLGKKINSSQPDIKGKPKGLFSDSTDLILEKFELKENPSDTSTTGLTAEEQKKADEEAKDANLQLFLDRVNYIPKPNLKSDDTFSKDLEALTIIGSFNDQVAFQGLKEIGDAFKKNTDNSNAVSPLMPIKFTGTMHGIGGLKRGDKFIINGLPKEYQDNGFFQVTAVKHIIEGMNWKTEIEGGFRKKLN